MELFLLLFFCIFCLLFYLYGKKHPEKSVEECVTALKEWIKDASTFEPVEVVYNAGCDAILATNVASAIQPYVKNKLDASKWKSDFLKGKIPRAGYEIIVADEKDFPVIEALVRKEFEQNLINNCQLGRFDVAINKKGANSYILCITYAITETQIYEYDKLQSARQSYVQQKLAAQVSAPVDDELETAISSNAQE